MRVAICEDEPVQAVLLKTLAQRWAAARTVPLTVECFPTAEAFLFCWAEDRGFDLLMLDIQMPGRDGLALAREVRREDRGLPIVFVTGYSDHMGEGYEVAALHYLLKPVDEEKLFSFPLDQNVAASTDPEEARVKSCLEETGFGGRLGELPQGMHTYLYRNFEESGVEISGGEAQKIALARALYRDAPFLILDEPTAALDPVSEYEVYSSFDQIVGERTAVYISHRLSSCRFCDDIAVFHRGKLVQRGGHDQLLREDGLYRRLWNAQAQYYVDAES